MKKNQWTTLMFLFFIPSFIMAQEQDYTINDTFNEKAQYFFDRFHEGKVYFESGKVAQAHINYNVVLEEIHFLRNLKINRFTNANEINRVKIGNVMFFRNDNKIFQVVYGKEDLVLLKRREADLRRITENEGAYGTYSATSSTRKYTSLIQTSDVAVGSHAVNFEEKGDTPVPVETKFYLKYKGEYDYVNKRRFYRYFRDHKREIKNYMKENNLDMDKEEDLIKMINFCSQFIEPEAS